MRTSNGWDLETKSRSLKEAVNCPPSSCRQQFVVLLGPNMVTSDEMQAFIYSVDLAFSFSDLSNLKTVLRRAATRHKDFYAPFIESLRIAGTN